MDKEKVILILETLAENMAGTQREAINAVIEYIKEIPDCRAADMPPEQRRERIKQILEKCQYQRDRENMTETERREAARYYLDGLPPQ